MKASRKILPALFLFLGLLIPGAAKAEGMAELLGKAHELSSKISALGELGEQKIQNSKVEEYNSQMQQNNSLTQQALAQVAKRLNVDLPSSTTSKGGDLITKGLQGLKGAAFEQNFLNKSVNLQSQLLELVKSKLLPMLNSPLAEGLLKNFAPGLSSLVEKGKALQQMIGKID